MERKNIIKYIKSFNQKEINYILNKISIYNKDILKEYLANLDENSNFKYLEAYNQLDECIAGMCYQICVGPLPGIPTFFECGSIWGFWGEKSSLEKLILISISELRKKNVFKILSYSYNEDINSILHNLRFSHSNALEFQFTNYTKPSNFTEIEGIEIKYIGEEYDEEIFNHWKRMWEDNGIKTFKDNSKEMTLDFITEARKKNKYQSIGAFKDKELIGSVSLNAFFGVEPIDKVGVIWAVYVHPEYRRRGIGTRLTEEIINHFNDLNFNSIRLIYASEEGKRIYLKKGFYKGNYLILDLNEINKCHYPFITDLEITNDLLSLCVPGQLKALNITNIESQFKGNLFEEKKSKMGKGFKMKNFDKENSISKKFDKLSTNWEDFITGMKYEYVFQWLVEQYNSNKLDENKIILDECCGVGLQGQTLRLSGFKGKLIGCDISEGMLKKAYHRGIYNDLFIQNINEDLLIYDEYVDMIINVGSMELLDIPFVIKSSHRVLKSGGIFLVSFQWDNGNKATEHQNIKGLKENDMIKLLEENGFRIEDIKRCENAFYTPKPNEEKSELVPVPYIFIRAIKK